MVIVTEEMVCDGRNDHEVLEGKAKGAILSHLVFVCRKAWYSVT